MLGMLFPYFSDDCGGPVAERTQGCIGRDAAHADTPNAMPATHMHRLQACIAEDFGHVQVTGNVLSARAYEKPSCHYEGQKDFLRSGVCPESFAMMEPIIASCQWRSAKKPG